MAAWFSRVSRASFAAAAFSASTMPRSKPPSFASSRAGASNSATSPRDSTSTRSLSTTVLSRCAIVIVVQPENSSRITLCSTSSVRESMFAVGLRGSKTKNRGGKDAISENAGGQNCE